MTPPSTSADTIASAPGGTRAPLFIVHPIGGSVTAYVRLRSMLTMTNLVYAIEDPAVHGTASRS